MVANKYVSSEPSFGGKEQRKVDQGLSEIHALNGFMEPLQCMENLSPCNRALNSRDWQDFKVMKVWGDASVGKENPKNRLCHQIDRRNGQDQYVMNCLKHQSACWILWVVLSWFNGQDNGQDMSFFFFSLLSIFFFLQFISLTVDKGSGFCEETLSFWAKLTVYLLT